MPKYMVFVSERLIHTIEVEAENREAIADMVGDMETPIKTETMAYEYLPEFTEDIENEEMLHCEICGDERVASDLNSELRCPPCEEKEG